MKWNEKVFSKKETVESLHDNCCCVIVIGFWIWIHFKVFWGFNWMFIRIQVSKVIMIENPSMHQRYIYRFRISQDSDDVKIFIWTSRNRVEYKTIQIGILCQKIHKNTHRKMIAFHWPPLFQETNRIFWMLGSIHHFLLKSQYTAFLTRQ